MGKPRRDLNCEWLFEQYETLGKSGKVIADETGLNRATVFRNLRDCGIKPRNIAESVRLKYPNGRFGDAASHWKGGRRVLNGYMFVYDPLRKRIVQEHRLVMEQELGRPLLPNEVVHHRDGNKQNNSPDNLEVKVRGAHVSEHFQAGYNGIALQVELDRLKNKLARYEALYGPLDD